MLFGSVHEPPLQDVTTVLHVERMSLAVLALERLDRAARAFGGADVGQFGRGLSPPVAVAVVAAVVAVVSLSSDLPPQATSNIPKNEKENRERVMTRP